MATVTVPTSEYITRDSGSLLLTVSHAEHPTTTEHLLRLGDFHLTMQEGAIVLDNATTTIQVPTHPFPGQLLIVWTWVQDTHKLLAAPVEDTVDFSRVYEAREATLFGDFSSTLSLTPTDDTAPFSGAFQRLQMYISDLVYEDNTYYTLDRFINDTTPTFEADYTTPTHYKQGIVVESTMAPRDGSPILMEDDFGPLRRQYFFDPATGLYRQGNTERFVYEGEDVLYLSYAHIDPDYHTTVTFDNGESFIHHHDPEVYIPEDRDNRGVYLRLSNEQKDRLYGLTVDIDYQLARSYAVEYNEDTAYDSLRVHLVSPKEGQDPTGRHHSSESVTLIQEGNRFSNQKLAKEIELNPLVNAQHTGFMYIDTQEQTAQAFRLNMSSAYVNGNGMDTAVFIVEAIDEEGNEVLSPYVDVWLMDAYGRRSDDLGVLSPVVNHDTLKARNAAGRCYFEYQAPLLTRADAAGNQRVFAIAYDRQTGIGAQFPIVIRPVESGAVTQRIPTQPEANLPFEYFARYFERPLEADSPLASMDRDADGLLGREDLDVFMSERYNKTRMQELNHQLRQSEVFS